MNKPAVSLIFYSFKNCNIQPKFLFLILELLINLTESEHRLPVSFFAIFPKLKYIIYSSAKKPRLLKYKVILLKSFFG